MAQPQGDWLVHVRTDEKFDEPGRMYRIVVHDGQGRLIDGGIVFGPPEYVRKVRESYECDGGTGE